MAMNVGDLVAYLSLDDTAFRRTLNAAGSGMASLGKMSLKAGAGIAALGSGVQVIAGIAAVAAQASGALVVLPAVAGAAAFGMKALSVATTGFGDAMSSMDDPAAFAEAIAELSPAAQEAAKAVRDLKPAWDTMVDSVQEKAFTGLAPVIQKLGGTYLPILGEGFGRVAVAANGAALDVGELMGGTERVGRARQMVDNFAATWEELLPALGQVGVALFDVATVGSGFLPGLVAGARDAAEAFSMWAESAAGQERIREIISGGLDALGKLGQVAGNVGEILGGVFRAASVDGGSLLDTMVATTQAIADMVNSVAGQTVLSAFFETAAALSASFMSVLQALLPAVAPLIPLIGQLAQVIGGGLAEVLIAIMPAVALLVEALVTALQPVLPVIAAAFSKLAEVLGPLAMQLAETIAPLLPQIAELFIALVEAVLPLLPPLADLITALLPVVGAILENVVIPAIRWVIDVFAEWMGVLADVLQVVADVVSGIVSFFTDLSGNIDRIFADIERWIGEAWESAVQWTEDAWANLTGAVSSGIDATVNWVRNLPRQILDIILGLGRDLASSGRAIVDDFLGGIKAGWNVLMDWVEAGMATLRGLWPFSPAKHGPFAGAGYVTHSGAALTGDFASSLRAGMPGVIASARDLMAAAHVELSPTAIAPRPPGTGATVDDVLRRGGGPDGGASGISIQINYPHAERASDAIGRAGSVLAAVGPWGDE